MIKSGDTNIWKPVRNVVPPVTDSYFNSLVKWQTNPSFDAKNSDMLFNTSTNNVEGVQQLLQVAEKLHDASKTKEANMIINTARQLLDNNKILIKVAAEIKAKGD